MTYRDTISQKCIQCKLCRKECKFLRRYGDPKSIADSFDPTVKKHRVRPFECSLCGLCAEVCPAGIDPARMFLEMRQAIYRLGRGDYPEHSTIIGYEKRGASRRYSYYALPRGCDTVLFPGCTLPGTRPDRVLNLFEHLKQTVPSLGIVLDCCTKPSHDLGRLGHFHPMFDEMEGFLSGNGVRHVLVACPNCYRVFKQHSAVLSVRTVYELLAEEGFPKAAKIGGAVTVHDPCAVRGEDSIHTAVRELIAQTGLTIEEMDHHGKRTVCCGEGGSVGFLAPELAGNWRAIRTGEARGKRIVSYCAGCVNFLGAVAPATHILDLLFEPEAAVAGKVKVSRAPFTYWNRIRLKATFAAKVDAPVRRERVFTPETRDCKKNPLARLLLLGAVLAAIPAVRTLGAGQYLGQDKLRGLIGGAVLVVCVMLILFFYRKRNSGRKLDE
ncbi:MAG: (Fe-S)-binding protein [Syntrophobacteraceae bacterium]|nr:(Fe-S)-binding protein [Syntrophobacteraceae bacterium]